jgi:hypothetical protein
MIREKFSDIAILGGIFGGYYYGTDSTLPFNVPDWWPVLVVGGIAGAVAIAVAAGKIEDLWPDTHGVYIVVINAQRDDVVEMWELTEDQWADLEVVDGPLNELPNCKHRAYEAMAYNPAQNVAVGTWRHSVPASQMVGHNEVDDALDMIHEVREYLEPRAKRGRYIRQNLPGIVRALDRERARNQARALEPQVAPSFGGESVNDALDEVLPEELTPTRLAKQEETEELADETGTEPGIFEVLEDDQLDEPLEPINGTNGHESEQ